MKWPSRVVNRSEALLTITQILMLFLLAIATTALDVQPAIAVDNSIMIVKQAKPIPMPGKIAFLRHVDGIHAFLLDGATKKEKRLTYNESDNLALFCEYPKWSPAGTHIAIACSPGNVRRTIFHVNGDGTGLVEHVHTGSYSIGYQTIEWIDEDNIRFKGAKRGQQTDTWFKININSNIIEDAKAPAAVDDKKWNNTKTLYAKRSIGYLSPEFYEIFDSNGTSINKLEGGPLGEIYGWSPDSKCLLYCEGCGYEQLLPTIRLLNIQNGKSYPVTKGQEADWYYSVQ